MESGSYLMNFASCIACGRKEPLKITDKATEEDEDGEELITYKRMFVFHLDNTACIQNIKWQQCCQLSQIIQETPDFEPFLPVSRLESEISQIIPEVCYFL